MTPSIGLDFGTTNTVATVIDAQGQAQAVRFDHGGGLIDAFRSVLCFWEPYDDEGPGTQSDAGPWAIDRFLELEGDCRFIQSFKTFAASPLFADTLIFEKRLKFEELLATFLRKVSAHAGIDFPERVVIGRPVKFAGAAPDETLARARYEAALNLIGVKQIDHVYEPVAAAYFFAQRLTSEATILVADFGGGTSDFSVVRFTPGKYGLDYSPLSHSGVGVAGDAFDFRIIDEVVAPAFGKGSDYMSDGKILPVPRSFFAKFSHWNELSIMRHSRDFRELQKLLQTAREPARIEAFLAFLEADAGYAMNRAVTDLKVQLSHADEGTLSFHVAGVDIERTVKRTDFESWIAPELGKISASVDQALADAGLEAGAIDRVFLTGGSSFVPAVRDLFERRFGVDKIETGDQLVSISNGLALISREEDIDVWSV